jgi:hypothetical protein
MLKNKIKILVMLPNKRLTYGLITYDQKIPIRSISNSKKVCACQEKSEEFVRVGQA